MKKTSVIVLALVCIVCILAVGCTTQKPATTAGMQSATTTVQTIPQTIAHSGGPGSVVYIRMRENSFDPSFVTIKAGTTVTWTNEDAIAHTATYTGEGPKVFDSGSLVKGASFSNTFNTKGRYIYACTQHSSMTGTIVVE
jgi:plastocyanin